MFGAAASSAIASVGLSEADLVGCDVATSHPASPVGVSASFFDLYER